VRTLAKILGKYIGTDPHAQHTWPHTHTINNTTHDQRHVHVTGHPIRSSFTSQLC
jgi:hypothetical protein